MSVLLDVYVFIAWFGSWSTASGFGAFVIFIMWTAILVFSVAASYFGGWVSIILTIISLGSNAFLAPMIALGAWILYFCGLGDWLSNCLPGCFPVGGYFFSDASASVLEWLILAGWGCLRVSSARFMLK